MVKKVLFLLIPLLSVAFQPMNADNKIKGPETEWDDENDRSLPSVPQLSIDEQNLYIRSSVELTNLDVCIRDSREMKLTILNTTEKTLLIFNL